MDVGIDLILPFKVRVGKIKAFWDNLYHQSRDLLGRAETRVDTMVVLAKGLLHLHLDLACVTWANRRDCCQLRFIFLYYCVTGSSTNIIFPTNYLVIALKTRYTLGA